MELKRGQNSWSTEHEVRESIMLNDTYEADGDQMIQALWAKLNFSLCP